MTRVTGLPGVAVLPWNMPAEIEARLACVPEASR